MRSAIVRIDESRVEVELIDLVKFRPESLGWHFRYPQVLAIVPFRLIEDGLLRRDSYDSLQTGHQLSTIQIATTKRKLASVQSIKAVFIRKMDFLLWTGVR